MHNRNIILLMVLSVFLFSCHTGVPQEFENMALWVRVPQLEDSRASLAQLESRFRQIAQEPTDRVRRAIYAWLMVDRDDPFEIDDRLTNAHILCVYMFNLPRGHGYYGYFSDVNSLTLRLPRFMDSVKVGELSGARNIEWFMKEFDGYAKTYGRRDRKINAPTGQP